MEGEDNISLHRAVHAVDWSGAVDDFRALEKSL